MEPRVKNFFGLLLILQRLAFTQQIFAQQTPSTTDVVIVGAGSGGIAAAIQAAREGSKVVLLEETDYIGGQTTGAGVTSMDGNYAWRYGIYKEYTDKIIAHYQTLGKSVGTCYWGPSTICFEPKVGKNIFEEMIASEPNITLLKRTRISSVEKTNNAITGITTSNNQSIQTNIVIDATEYGDVIMLTEPNYRLGNGTKQSPSSNACIQDITYLAVMKKYPNGVPSELKITTPPPEYTDAIKQIFRGIVSQSGNTTWTGAYPVTWNVHNAYRGMPDSSSPENYDAGNSNNYSQISKTGINWANDFPRNAYTGSSDPIFLPTTYLTDKNYRKQVNCNAKLRTIQFIYYVQTELGQNNWSVANDEGYDTPYNSSENSCENIPAELKEIEKHLPVIPYVREGVRGIGLHTLNGAEIIRQGNPSTSSTTFPSSIAIGDYPNDLHNCSENEHLELDLESRDHVTQGGTFQVPIESLISKSTKGLIYAEKNLSQSRLVNGATRLQPITMLTGQAAGALASIMSKSDNFSPSITNLTIQVQKILLQNGSPLFPFNDLKPGDPFFIEGQIVAALQIMTGKGKTTFAPNDPLSRDQAAIVLLRSKKGYSYAPPTPSSQRFTDVSPNNFAYAWIDAFAAEGITSGCGNNNFCPNGNITRSQFAVLLLKTKNGSSYTPPPATGVFNDVPTNHALAAWIEALSTQGITSGCGGGNFCPDEIVSRGQSAVFILKAFPELLQSISTTTPLPGDLDTDGDVDIFDYNKLVSSFGNPYTIFDYNNVLENYGS